MRILVTISRDWDDYETAGRVLAKVVDNNWDVDVTVVHGASGMDWFLAGVACAKGVEIEAHPADWKTHGKAAGIIRNNEMAKSNIDLCLAFIKNGSAGASHCARATEYMGIPTWRYTA